MQHGAIEIDYTAAYHASRSALPARARESVRGRHCTQPHLARVPEERPGTSPGSQRPASLRRTAPGFRDCKDELLLLYDEATGLVHLSPKGAQIAATTLSKALLAAA